LQAEITILSKLAFNVHVEHPHGFLLNYISSLELSNVKGFPQKALNYANDILCTITPVLFQPNVVACAALYLAALEFEDVNLPEEPAWYRVFDAELEDLELIIKLLMDSYSVTAFVHNIDSFLKPDNLK
jgi:hypothetical protein